MAVTNVIVHLKAKRPRDVELHIRLVKIYATTGRLIDAISHCVSVIKTKAFNDNQEWWRCTIDVFEVCINIFFAS